VDARNARLLFRRRRDQASPACRHDSPCSARITSEISGSHAGTKQISGESGFRARATRAARPTATQASLPPSGNRVAAALVGSTQTGNSCPLERSCGTLEQPTASWVVKLPLAVMAGGRAARANLLGTPVADQLQVIVAQTPGMGVRPERYCSTNVLPHRARRSS